MDPLQNTANEEEGQEKQRNYIIQEAKYPFFARSTASFAIQ